MNTKLAANYGTIAGLFCFGYFVLLSSMGLNPLGNFKFIGSLVPIYFLYAGTKKYRDIDLTGNIKYGQAFVFSLVITFFYATIFAALVYIYGKIIDIEVVEIYKADTLKQMEKVIEVMGENSKMVDKAITEIESMSIGKMAMGEYWNKVIWGFILALIIAGILKKEKPLFDEN